MLRSGKLLAVPAALAFMLVVGAVVWLGGQPAVATGGTIAAPDGPDSVGLFSSLALDALGNPVVSYYGATNGDLKVLHCNDPNCMGGNESITAPDTAGDVGTYGSLALDIAGNPVVSYYSATDGDLKVLHCNDPNCAGGDESITVPDAGGGVGGYTSLALDVAGDPVVSYYDWSADSLKLLHCGNANCTSGNSITTPDTVGGWDTSLVLDGAGNPVVSYSALYLRVLHCNDPDCTGGDEIITDPDTTGAGNYTSLALDAAGNPVVSYFHGPPNADLRLLHCGDPNCTSGNTIAIPDTAGDVGRETSLVLDGAGNPVVSYFDSLPNFDLKLLHCGNPACTAGNTIVAPDTAGTVGSFSSLVLDALGNPVASYHDFTNANLRVLHCADSSCNAVKSTPTPKPTSPSPPSGQLDFSIGIDTNTDTTDDCSTTGTAPGPETPTATKTPGSPNLCSLPPGAAFQLNVYLNSVPAGVNSYVGFDFVARFTGVGPKAVNPSDDPIVDIIPIFDITWPDCGFAAGRILTPGFRTPKVAVSCGIGIAAPPSTFTGKLVAIHFNCANSGTISIIHGETIEPEFDGLLVPVANTALLERTYPFIYHVEGDAVTETLAIDCTGAIPTPPPPPAVGGVSRAIDPAAARSDGLTTAALAALGALVFLAVAASASYAALRARH